LWDPEGTHLRYLTTSIGPESNQPPDSYDRAQFDLPPLFSARALRHRNANLRSFREKEAQAIDECVQGRKTRIVSPVPNQAFFLSEGDHSQVKLQFELGCRLLDYDDPSTFTVHVQQLAERPEGESGQDVGNRIAEPSWEDVTVFRNPLGVKMISLRNRIGTHGQGELDLPFPNRYRLRVSISYQQATDGVIWNSDWSDWRHFSVGSPDIGKSDLGREAVQRPDLGKVDIGPATVKPSRRLEIKPEPASGVRFTVTSPEDGKRYLAAPGLKFFVPERVDVTCHVIECPSGSECEQYDRRIQASELQCNEDETRCQFEGPFDFQMTTDRAYTLFVRPLPLKYKPITVEFEVVSKVELPDARKKLRSKQ